MQQPKDMDSKLSTKDRRRYSLRPSDIAFLSDLGQPLIDVNGVKVIADRRMQRDN